MKEYQEDSYSDYSDEEEYSDEQDEFFNNSEEEEMEGGAYQLNYVDGMYGGVFQKENNLLT